MDHPFIIKMAYSFQNERKLFFALEFCPGGELFSLLQQKQRFAEEQARFYSAQIVLCIEYLHSKNIIYRDLKPENVLIDSDGYIKITDFGLSKMNIQNQRMAQSVCGTPEYLAPEILFKMGHGKPVDWWTLGAIIFEMLTGLPPFYTTNRQELFERIKFGSLKYPSYISPPAKNLLEGLFQKNPENRLGIQGAQQIKEHQWFSFMNWQMLLDKQIKPPFQPKVRSEVDVTNFEMEFTEQPIESFDQSLSMASMNNVYPNFTYQAKKPQYT